jgi:hypothetical protein
VTKQYYPSLRVIRRLHQLLSHADDKVREEAEESFQSIRYEVLNRLRGRSRRVAEHVRQWLSPVWDLLQFCDEELRTEEDEGTLPRREEPAGAMTRADLLDLLADLDASPALLGDRLRSNGWSGYAGDERGRLRSVLLTHPDQLVREEAASRSSRVGGERPLSSLMLRPSWLRRRSPEAYLDGHLLVCGARRVHPRRYTHP